MSDDQNLADFIYFTMYRLINGIFETSFIGIMGSYGGVIYTIATIAIILIGYRLMYPSRDGFATNAKSMVAIVLVLIFAQNSSMFYDVLKTSFIDIPVQAGNKTISAMISAMSGAVDTNLPGYDLGSQDLSFNPDGSKSAFGALWDFSTTLASRVWEEGGIRNMGALFMGAVLFGFAVFLLVVQIFIMATGLILATSCILAAPVFMWMILFKSTRNMFEKWIGMGLTGGVLLYLMVVALGIIIAFMATIMASMMGYDIFNPTNQDVDSEGFEFKIDEFLATTVFLYSAIKLLPKVDTWASSLGGFAAHGFLEGSMAVGKAISDKAGQMGIAGAKKIDLTPPKLTDPNEGNEFKDINIRDSMMNSRIGNSGENQLSHNPSNPNDDKNTSPNLLESKNSDSLNQNEKHPDRNSPSELQNNVPKTYSENQSRSNDNSGINTQSGEGISDAQFNDVDNDIQFNNDIKNEDNSNITEINQKEIEASDSNKTDDSVEQKAERNEAMMHFEQARIDEERRDAAEADETKKQSDKLDQINSKTESNSTRYSDKETNSKKTSDNQNSNNQTVVEKQNINDDKNNMSDGSVKPQPTELKRKESKEFKNDKE